MFLPQSAQELGLQTYTTIHGLTAFKDLKGSFSWKKLSSSLLKLMDHCPWGARGFTGRPPSLSSISQSSFSSVILARNLISCPSSRLKPSTVGWANKMLFVDFHLKAFKSLVQEPKNCLHFSASSPHTVINWRSPLTQWPRRKKSKGSTFFKKKIKRKW